MYYGTLPLIITIFGKLLKFSRTVNDQTMCTLFRFLFYWFMNPVVLNCCTLLIRKIDEKISKRKLLYCWIEFRLVFNNFRNFFKWTMSNELFVCVLLTTFSPGSLKTNYSIKKFLFLSFRCSLASLKDTNPLFRTQTQCHRFNIFVSSWISLHVL